MRRIAILSALVALVVALAACSASTGPGWTLGPSPATEPPASASGSAAPSGSVTPSGSATPSDTAAPSGSVAPSPSAGGDVVQISAMGVAFEQSSVEAPADTAFTIHFTNKDAGQLHNVEIKDAGGASLFRGDIITGPAEADYAVPALSAGSYSFVCTVHPNMTGTLTAG